jgi:thioredoxin-dependent peroxiredoxin
VARAYGVLDGEVASRWTFYIGKDGKVLRIDKEVDPRSAGADIAATLESLGVERAP